MILRILYVPKLFNSFTEMGNQTKWLLLASPPIFHSWFKEIDDSNHMSHLQLLNLHTYIL